MTIWFRVLLVALAAQVFAGCAAPPRPNVLLVTFDTVRADHVGYASGQVGVTPILDALADRGVWFSTCVASQPLTLPSHTSILTGLEPYSHGVRNNGTYVVSPETQTLAERLGEAGYATHAIVSAFVLDSQFGLDQGFAGYDDDLAGGPEQKMFMFKEIQATQTAVKSVGWLEHERPSEQPFFLWLHFFDPHADYLPPPQFAARFPDEPYRGEIAYADFELGRVLAFLEDSELLEETLVVFVSDHGESLGEHGEKTHGIFVYEATTRVPMLMAGPGVPVGGRVDDLVRTTDIVPTVLDLLDLPGGKALDGASLMPLWKGRSEERLAYSESLVPRLNFGWAELRSLRDGRFKVIDAPRPETFDLEADPGESNDLRDGAVGLRADLEQIVGADPFAHGGHRPVEVSAGTREALAALGYVTTMAQEQHPGERPDPKDRIGVWEQFQHAQNLMRNSEHERAVVEIRDLLEIDPDNVVAMGSLANALSATGRREEALEVFRRMMAVAPQRETAFLGASRILREMGSFEDAAELAGAVIQMKPSDPTGHVSLGDTLLEQGRFDEAEVAFRKAREIDPHSMLAAAGMGNCLNRSGRLEEAQEILSAAQEHDPSSHAVTYNLAVVSDALGDQVKALALYRKAVELAPEHSMSWNNLGSLVNRLGDRKTGLEYIRKARELDDENVEAAYNLGVLVFGGGDAASALSLFEEVMLKQPSFFLAGVSRARCLVQLGRIDEAVEAWSALASRQPGAWLQVARLELARGNDGAARKALEQGLLAGGDKARQAAVKDGGLRKLLDSTAP